MRLDLRLPLVATVAALVTRRRFNTRSEARRAAAAAAPGTPAEFRILTASQSVDLTLNSGTFSPIPVFPFYLRQEVLRSVVFVGRFVGSFVREHVFGPNILKTAKDRDPVTMEHL